MPSILIKNGTVWDGENFICADILTQDKKIHKIHKNMDDNADYVYDASGKIVSAGLVDIHTHFKGISDDNIGISASMSSVPFGVTSAADAAASVGDTGIFNYLDVKTLVFVCADFKNNSAYFENTKRLIEIYGSRVVGVKVYFDTYMSDIHNTSPLEEVVEFADKHKLIVMIHSTNSPSPMKEIVSYLRSGDILTHAYHGGINTTQDDGFDCVFEAKKRGIIVDAGFAGHMHTDFNVFKSAVRVGALPDIISTDITRYSAYKRGGRYGMTMCMSIAKTSGMAEEDIFRAVTSSPAKALKMENRWGYLKTGRCADISVFEYGDEGFSLCDKQGNMLESKKGYRCLLTVSDGEIVYRN